MSNRTPIASLATEAAETVDVLGVVCAVEPSTSYVTKEGKQGRRTVLTIADESDASVQLTCFGSAGRAPPELAVGAVIAVRGARPRHLEMAGTCFRLVLSELSLANVYGDENLSWAPPLTTAALCALIQQAESDADVRVQDLGMFHDVDATFCDDDLRTLADARRLSMAFNLTGCALLTDSAVVAGSRFCTSLQALTLDGCTQLTDAVLSSCRKNNPMLSLLSTQHCSQLSDDAFVALASACWQRVSMPTQYGMVCKAPGKRRARPRASRPPPRARRAL